MEMNRVDRNQARLIDLQRHLEREVEQVGAAAVAAANVKRDPGDEADRASDEAEREADTGILNVLVLNAVQVDRALELIRGGLYGRCEDCEQEIPSERLEALPEATRCLRCQLAFDARGVTRPSA